MGIILIKLGGFWAALVQKDLALGIIRQQNAGPGAFCASNLKIELQSKKNRVFLRLRIGMSRNMKKDSEEQVSQACADIRA